MSTIKTVRGTIRFSAKRLDKLADQLFRAAGDIYANSFTERDPAIEANELAGIALRRWADQLRRSKKRKAAP